MDETADSHAVIVSVALPGADQSDEGSPDMFQLADRFDAAVRAAGVGEFDGDEFGEGEAVFYMYGPDADRLFAAVMPVLREVNAPQGSYVRKRYGPPGAREERISLPLR